VADALQRASPVLGLDRSSPDFGTPSTTATVPSGGGASQRAETEEPRGTPSTTATVPSSLDHASELPLDQRGERQQVTSPSSERERHAHAMDARALMDSCEHVMDASELMGPCEPPPGEPGPPPCVPPPDADQEMHAACGGEGGWVQSIQAGEVSGGQLLVRTAPVEYMEVTPHPKP